MDNNGILLRIRDLMQYLGLNTTNFAKKVGISQPNLSQILKGSRSCGEAVINKIVLSTGCDKNWLLTGEGEMIKDHSGSHSIKNEVVEVTEQEREMLAEGLMNGSFRLVPLKNIDSVGGIHSENEFSPSEQYTIKMLPFTEAREGDVAILQSGNSMYPTIPSGSVLLIREVVDWREYFGYGGIYVLWLRDGRRITKEVRRYDADPQNYVWCVSYNPDIADEELPKSMIRGVWKVVKYIADFGW